jgi:hypothetical protein
MSDPIMVRPIGVVSGGRGETFEVAFHFHKETRIRRGAAYPRGSPAWPRVGVLASHSRGSSRKARSGNRAGCAS